MNARYLMTGIVLVAVVAGGVFWAKKKIPVEDLTRVAPGETKIKGAAHPRVQIVEYSDFQCPACQKAAPMIAKVMQAHSSEVQIVFRHFPLPGHQWSGIAHQAAECANRSGKFWEYHDRLYAEQAVWSKTFNPTENFLEYAKDLGLNLDSFAVCLTDEGVRRDIMHEKARGEGLKIDSTPTFFVNGERLVGPADFEKKAESIIQKALNPS